MYPGQMPTIKLNLFNIVIVADLSQASTLNLLGGMAINVIERGFGYRWGVVPIIDTENSERIYDISQDQTITHHLLTGLKMARLLYWINRYLGRPSLMKYITRVSFALSTGWNDSLTGTADRSVKRPHTFHFPSNRLVSGSSRVLRYRCRIFGN